MLVASLVLVGATSASCGAGSTRPRPTNTKPAIDSIRVQPPIASVSDSITVTCFARDTDGDVLVYDWQTDSRLRINGVPANQPYKFGSPSSAERFYPQYSSSSLDTIYLSCSARDQHGASAARLVLIIIQP